MATETMIEAAALRCWIEDRRVCLELADGRFVSFPASKYPLLADAPQELLERVTLRLGGLALRWELLTKIFGWLTRFAVVFHDREDWRPNPSPVTGAFRYFVSRNGRPAS